MNGPPPALQAQGLSARLSEGAGIGPLDLLIETGEHVLLVGPSGCGKSTLLRTIAGLVAPSAGRLELMGHCVSEGRHIERGAQDRKIGFLFQGGALWPHMDVAAHLDFVLRGASIPRDQWSERRGQLLHQVDLEGFEDRKPATLSGGEAQRLGLARALAGNPSLLLLDEPLGPLDAQRRNALLECFESLREELALTILHVTHDPDEAVHLASQTLQMNPDGTLASTIVA